MLADSIVRNKILIWFIPYHVLSFDAAKDLLRKDSILRSKTTSNIIPLSHTKIWTSTPLLANPISSLFWDNWLPYKDTVILPPNSWFRYEDAHDSCSCGLLGAPLDFLDCNCPITKLPIFKQKSVFQEKSLLGTWERTWKLVKWLETSKFSFEICTRHQVASYQLG